MKRSLLAALAVLAVACTPPPVTPATSPAGTGSAAASAVVTDQTRGEIQAVLQRQNEAIARRQLEAYTATIDPQSLALRRCANEDFEVAGRQGVGSAAQVTKVEPYGAYVRAWVQDRGYGLQRKYFRKSADGKWLQAEPKESELGGEKKRNADGLQLDYWGIDEDIIDALAKGAASAKQVVLRNILSDKEPVFAMRFYPTRSSLIGGCRTAAFYLPNTPSDPYIRMVQYWFTPSGEAAPFTVEVMAHEWLHASQDAFSQGAGSRIPWWMLEGWPDYAGGIARSIRCAGTWPTMKQLEDGPNADPNVLPEVVGQYYGYSNTMVEYLYATYGGKDAYRRLVTAFIANANPRVVFPQVLNVTTDAFYEGWVSFARRKYC